MKIIFDQGAPVPLRAYLARHTVDTAYELAWDTVQNSELIQAAENAGYDLLVTTDQNLKYQQNLRGRKLMILVLLSTSWPRLRTHAQAIVQMIEAMQVGDYNEFALEQ
jgi:predicted nuclease of predicted toxin-antitoxin system